MILKCNAFSHIVPKIKTRSNRVTKLQDEDFTVSLFKLLKSNIKITIKCLVN